MIDVKIDNFEVNDVIKTLLVTKYVIVAGLEDGNITQEYWDNDLKLVAEIGREINKNG